MFSQIHEDFQPDKLAKVMNPEIDGDLPGLGQFYCIHCAYAAPALSASLHPPAALVAHGRRRPGCRRHFTDTLSLKGHLKSKIHKRR